MFYESIESCTSIDIHVAMRLSVVYRIEISDQIQFLSIDWLTLSWALNFSLTYLVRENYSSPNRLMCNRVYINLSFFLLFLLFLCGFVCFFRYLAIKLFVVVNFNCSLLTLNIIFNVRLLLLLLWVCIFFCSIWFLFWVFLILIYHSVCCLNIT